MPRSLLKSRDHPAVKLGATSQKTPISIVQTLFGRPILGAFLSRGTVRSHRLASCLEDLNQVIVRWVSKSLDTSLPSSQIQYALQSGASLYEAKQSGASLYEVCVCVVLDETPTDWLFLSAKTVALAGWRHCSPIIALATSTNCHGPFR